MLTIQESKRKGQPALLLSGELTIYSAADARQGLSASIGKGGPPEWDLSGIEEIDTAGVQVLLWAKREAAASGHPVAFVNHSAAVINAFDLLKVTGIFGDPILITPSGK